MDTEKRSPSSSNWWWRGRLFSRPRRTSGMVGRHEHKAQITHFLESDKARALHIVGIGGVGKTWLARWLAWQGRDARRSVAWIDCSQKSVTVESLVGSIAGVTRSRGIGSLQEHLDAQPEIGETDLLASALDECADALDESECILIFDDFHDLSERVATALQYRFLANVIPNLGEGRLVIVSRRVPAIWDEPKLKPFQERIRLQGFTEEETRDFLASRDLDLSPQLIDRLRHKAGQGVPMALELLSARLRDTRSDDQVVKTISETPIYRVSGVGNWLDAQVQDLRLRAYRFLSTLSILRRPETAQFCKKLWQLVAPDEDFDSRLEALRSRSLLNTADSEISVSNLFREYIVEERLSQRERSELNDRAAIIYLEEEASADDLEERKDFLVEAVWHASQSGDVERVVKAAQKLARLPGLEDDFALLAQVDKLACRAARTAGDYESLVHWSCLLGNRLRLSGDLKEASSVLREGYDTARSHSSKERQFRVLRLLAGTVYAQGDYEQASQLYKQCLELAEAIGDLNRELIARVELANTQLRTNEITAAEEGLRLSIELARELDNQNIEANAQCKLGRLYLKHKPETTAQDDARKALRSALAGFRHTGNRSGQAEANSLLGDYHRYREEWSSAARYYRRTREIEQELGHRAKEAITVGRMAFLERDRGDIEEALRLSDESLRLSDRHGNPKGRQIQLVLSAELMLELDNPDSARERVEHALRISRNLECDRIGEASAYRALAKYYRYVGDYGAAKDSIERALAAYVETESFQYARETWQILESIYQEWASHSDIEALNRELGRVAGDSTEVYHEDRTILLARQLLARLAKEGELSGYLSDIIELLVSADIPQRKWGQEVLSLCVEEWSILSPTVIEEALYWLEPVAQRRNLFEAWIAAAIREGETECYDAIVEGVADDELSFREQFALLEPLEPDLVERPGLDGLRNQVAGIYVNGLTREMGRCIRGQRALPPYARDARRALRYLDKEQFDYLETEVVQPQLQAARDDKVVDDGFDPLQDEVPDPDLSDRRVVLMGAYERVRHWVRKEATDRFGLELREVPPAWEANVSTRRVSELVRGADLIVTVSRCMTHQGQFCLDSVGPEAPILDAPGTGKSSIIRTIKEHFTTEHEAG